MSYYHSCNFKSHRFCFKRFLLNDMIMIVASRNHIQQVESHRVETTFPKTFLRFFQCLFLVPLIGGRWYIVYNHPINSIYHLYFKCNFLISTDFPTSGHFFPLGAVSRFVKSNLSNPKVLLWPRELNTTKEVGWALTYHYPPSNPWICLSFKVIFYGLLFHGCITIKTHHLGDFHVFYDNFWWYVIFYHPSTVLVDSFL